MPPDVDRITGSLLNFSCSPVTTPPPQIHSHPQDQGDYQEDVQALFISRDCMKRVFWFLRIHREEKQIWATNTITALMKKEQQKLPVDSQKQPSH